MDCIMQKKKKKSHLRAELYSARHAEMKSDMLLPGLVWTALIAQLDNFNGGRFAAWGSSDKIKSRFYL